MAMHQGKTEWAPAVAGLLEPSRSHFIVITLIVVLHGAVFYFVARGHGARGLGADGPAMFGPVISPVWVPEKAGISSRPWRPETPLDQTPPPVRWTFPAIDLWPSAPGWSPTLSEFAPVTNARPDPPAMRHSSLRMIRWLRPVYASECSPGTEERSMVLDLLISAAGQPVEVKVVQSSGRSELDDAALGAARQWRFAPPLWQSRPVETRSRIELRFNC